MSDHARMVRQFMLALVARAGGVEAAAALIGARLGAEPSKGSISKRLAGHLSWPIEEVWALEDALGDDCVTRWRTRNRPQLAPRANLAELAAEATREHGEALGAVMQMIAGEGDTAAVRKELAEAQEAMRRLASMIEGTRNG